MYTDLFGCMYFHWMYPIVCMSITCKHIYVYNIYMLMRIFMNVSYCMYLTVMRNIRGAGWWGDSSACFWYDFCIFLYAVMGTPSPQGAVLLINKLSWCLLVACDELVPCFLFQKDEPKLSTLRHVTAALFHVCVCPFSLVFGVNHCGRGFLHWLHLISCVTCLSLTV